MTDRDWIYGAGAAVLTAALFAGSGAVGAGSAQAAEVERRASADASAVGDGPLITLYKNPTCDCCLAWAEHMRQNGFAVEVDEGADLAAVRAGHGVPPDAASCHTALVDGYAIEGHVPADVVHRLLRERPAVVGIAVPGMPPGVPGMPGEGSGSYDVVAFLADGGTRVYASK